MRQTITLEAVFLILEQAGMEPKQDGKGLTVSDSMGNTQVFVFIERGKLFLRCACPDSGRVQVKRVEWLPGVVLGLMAHNCTQRRIERQQREQERIQEAARRAAEQQGNPWTQPYRRPWERCKVGTTWSGTTTGR